MSLRIVQVCGLWFWVAFTFFIFVLLNQSRNLFPSNLYLETPERAAPKSSGLNTRGRMARSEKAWQSSVVLRHKMATAHPTNPFIPLFPAQKLDDFGKYPYTIWDFYPATYTCPHDIQRVGRLGDGGKWVCGMSLYEARPTASLSPSVQHPHYNANSKRATAPTQLDTVIYSFGVNDESTFEAEMLSRIPSAQIYAYDFSVSSFGPQLPPLHASRAHFHSVGLGGVDEPAKKPPFYTLSTLMAQNNHSYIDILKIDIEGSEYTALDAFMDSCEVGGKMPVGQVMIELHLVDDARVNFERFGKWWERLEGFGMRPVWLEINLLAVTLGKGKTDPRCVEYVWVNANDERSVLLGES